MAGKIDILVRILAQTDGLFWPMRGPDWRARAGGIVLVRQRDYAAKGICWSSGGAGADRISAMRLLDDLEVNGLIRVYRSRGRAGVFVRLTDRAEHETRALSDLPTVQDSHALLRRVIDLDVNTPEHGRLASELWLGKLRDYVGDFADRLTLIQIEALPALARGWLDSRSDVHGRTYYAATDAGRAAAVLPASEPSLDLPAPDRAAMDLYDTETAGYREQLRAAGREGPEIGVLPLPVGLGLRKPRRRRTTEYVFC